jgi:hypothetical protein
VPPPTFSGAEGAEFVDLRREGPNLPPSEAALLAYGRGLVDWQTRTVRNPENLQIFFLGLEFASSRTRLSRHMSWLPRIGVARILCADCRRFARQLSFLELCLSHHVYRICRSHYSGQHFEVLRSAPSSPALIHDSLCSLVIQILRFSNEASDGVTTVTMIATVLLTWKTKESAGQILNIPSCSSAWQQESAVLNGAQRCLDL